MEVWLIVGGSLVALWILMHMKKSRCDGNFIRGLHPYRRMMAYLMPDRNGAVVYFDDYVRVDKLLKYIEDTREHFHVDITHCLVGAFARAIAVAPTMNRFTTGRRLYTRKSRYLTFSMKRKRMNKKAKIAAVKTRVEPKTTFRELCQKINEKIGIERSEKVTYTDKELNFFLKLPRPLLRGGIRFFKFLDYFNLLPGSFIHPDPMYTSIFIANLGSVGMRAGYHHLYEWGNCPLFVMAGAIEDRPVVEDGEIVIRKMMHLRYTYDERIDDGLTSNFGISAARETLENPYELLGCLKADGSDTVPLEPPGYVEGT